jgi:hypothetical protein
VSARETHVRLRSGATERTCWVDRNVQVGQSITLKDSDEPDRLWQVVAASKDATPPERGWRVGGLT